MKKTEKIIICISSFFIITFNPLSWLYFFDQDEYLGLSNIILILLFNFVLFIFILVIFYYKNAMSALKLLSFNIMGILFGCIIIEIIFGNWFIKKSIGDLWLPSNHIYKINLRNISKYVLGISLSDNKNIPSSIIPITIKGT